MDKDYKQKFIDFTTRYAQGLFPCFCATTGEGYPIVFARSHFIRFLDFFNERYSITIKASDKDATEIYEKIMVDEINKYIEQCKQEQSKRDKEAAKTKNVKRKKD